MNAYKITNSINGKSYIGITVGSIEERFLVHLSNAQESGNTTIVLYNAIRKYGSAAFTVEHIASCITNVRKDLGNLEVILIKQHNTKVPNGYNMTDGGDGMSGWTPTEEQCIAKSEQMKIYHANMSLERKTEIAENISIAKKGQPSKLKGRPSPLKGTTKSEEFCRNASIKQTAFALANPEEMSRRGKMQDPIKKSEIMTEVWERPGYREKISPIMSESAKKRDSKPGASEARQAQMREVWRKRKEGILPKPVSKK